MAKKKIDVVTLQSVKSSGKYLPLGSSLKLDAEAAERLLAAGAVELPRPVLNPPPAETLSPAETALIKRFSAARTLDELAALLPEKEPKAAVAAAAQQRRNELENPTP